MSDDRHVTIELEDFRRILQRCEVDLTVDSDWYANLYGDIGEIASSNPNAAREHYRNWGCLEGRLPRRPLVDESWYLSRYPDVREGVTNGVWATGYDHYVAEGHKEGRAPLPID